MKRTRLKPGQVQFAQPLGDGPLRHRDAETPSDLRTQIQAPPAHHLVDLGDPVRRARGRSVRSSAPQSTLPPHLAACAMPGRRCRAHYIELPSLAVSDGPFLSAGQHRAVMSLQHHRDRQNRRACAASSLFAENARSSAAVRSAQVIATAALIRSSMAANRRRREKDPHP